SHLPPYRHRSRRELGGPMRPSRRPVGVCTIEGADDPRRRPTRREMTMKVDAELDERFSSPDVSALPWTDAERQLREADVFWLATVRPDGRPHVVPLIAVWLDGSLYFSTSEGEQKAVNLANDDRVSVITGSNDIDAGF